MSDRPRPKAGILEIAPYVPGRAAPKGSGAVKLSANESPIGPSDAARLAFAEAASRLEVYPEGSSAALREALGTAHGIDPARIVCGNGSDDLLHLLAQAYLSPGESAVMSRYGFSVYPIITRATGAQILMAEETDFTADVDAIIATVRQDTRMVFLANPNNPTGTCLPVGEVRRLREGLQPDILLVIDSAYAEFVTAADYSPGIELVTEATNTVMVRTFSKIGLAAARVGWLYGPAEIVDALNRIRGPFNVNLAGQAAAIATTKDRDFLDRLKAHNARWRDWLSAELSGNRLTVLPSQANFVLVRFPGEDEAQAAFDALLADGYVVRQVGVYGLPEALRISIGSEEAMRGVAKTLKRFGAGA